MAHKKKRAKKFRSFEPLEGQLGGREALRRLLHYVWAMKTPVFIAFLFTLLWAGINVGYGSLAKGFFDIIQYTKGPDRLNFFFLLGLLALVARAVCYFGMQYSWAYCSNRLTLRLRNEVFAHLQYLPIGFFDHRKTGQLMASLSSDVPSVTDVLDALRDIISAPLVLVGGTAVLFYINWPLALVACLCLPPIAWIITRATRKIEGYAERLQNDRARVLDVANETLGAIRVVKSFANEEYEIERFERVSHNVAQSVLRTVRLRSLVRPSVEFLGSLAIFLVLWVAGHQMLKQPGVLTFGSIVWFVMVLKAVGDAARDFGQISVLLSVAGVAADRVFTLLDYESDIREKPEAIELKRVQGQVTFDRVEFAYSSGIPVLADISFTMEPGEVVALVGPTGAGKTTVAALIPRFYDVTRGAIRVDGVDLRDCTLKSLRDRIGIVPQETVLFAGTLRDNIRYGRLDASDEEIAAAAKTANAWEFIDRLPEGLDTLIGERGVMLSGGQRQRIAIARAVLRDPRILILDEATSSLDSHSEALVQDALQKLVAHRTTLVIAHRLSTIRNADKILVIKEGHIVEAGRHEELLARDGVYSNLYQTQYRQDDRDTPPRLLE